MKYDINKILELLPHRYPFLLVDRIEDLVLTDDLVEVTGIKNVTINEPFFQGHFPDEPVMPGVLIIESMGQVAAVLLKLYTEIKENERRLVYVTSIDRVKFRRPVKPGDQLKTVATLVKRRGNNFKFKFRATIDGDLAAEGLMGCVVSSGLTIRPEA
ncbi:MAG TPA: 3-hydroxyacyl-[acyl-carrier-protein] dehydratase FabZ [Synergistaceae bacterium]|nr:3-hydroxyacyl-[acyl-carrier-protein] dehydratase FabZ [Synergistaceae bacterium]